MESVPTPLLPAVRMPPPAMFTSPPIVPIPPSVAPEATLVGPVEADWSPLISSVPAFTVVAPL
ncbi:hypothetical protein D3C73_737880 [compost metagenome]